MTDPILKVRDLTVHIPTPAGTVMAADRVSFEVRSGEIIGLVGESGSGKSVTALALMRLQPGKARVSGTILFDGQDILRLPARAMARLRGSAISIIFQDPLSYLNPVMRVGAQVVEAIRLHQPLSSKAARAHAIELLSMVGMPSPQRVFDAYPHELSGGMRQRVLIAVAISGRPKLLIGDEPTTALDVTVQAQIMSLLADLCQELGSALILITHDLGLVAEYCSRAYVMYAGRIVESAEVDQLFHDPMHPYSRGLLRSVLPVDRKVDAFDAIEGNVPQLVNVPHGCLFRPRCAHAFERCATEIPAMIRRPSGQQAACWMHEGQQ